MYLTGNRVRTWQALVVCLLLLTLYAAPGTALADTVLIAVPADVELMQGPDGDRVIFVGKALGFVGDAQNCAMDPEPRPLQPVVLVDGGGGRTTRSDAVVVLYINGEVVTGLKNGSRIVNLARADINGNPSADAECEVGGRPYYRYTGTLE